MCWQAAKFKNQLWHFEIFLTQDHMGLKISKCYSDFLYISSDLIQLDEDITYNGIQAFTFLAIGQVLKMFVALRKSNMGVNG